MSDQFVKPDKPLGRKAYGSIGHLPGSRLGPGDHRMTDGESLICTQGAPGKRVTIQTKLDGSCVAAAMLDDGSVIALGRAGYLARTSNHEMHHLWADYVEAHALEFDAVLSPGYRIVGEWLAQAHGTIYDLAGREPFVAFDIMFDSQRLNVGEFEHRTRDLFTVPASIAGPMEPQAAIALLDDYGADSPEGVVYRVESTRKGVTRIDFLAKWVRPDKVDGKYLIDHEPIWNWRAAP